MDILNLNKINGGISWNNQDKFFTSKFYNESYDIPDIKHIVIELDMVLFWFNVDQITVDGLIFSDPIDLRNYIFNI